MKYLELEGILNDPCLKMLIRGEWKADDLVVWSLFQDKSEVPIFPGMKDSIEKNWE